MGPVSAGRMIAPLSTHQLSQSRNSSFPFDNHRTTSDTERRNERVMRTDFPHKPVSPVRNSGEPVNISNGGPDESVFRACQQSSSRTLRYAARSEFFRQSHEVTKWLFARDVPCSIRSRRSVRESWSKSRSLPGVPPENWSISF